MRAPIGAALLASLWLVSSASAQVLLNENPGFEAVSRALAPGEQTNGLGGASTLVGTYVPFPFGGGTVDWSSPVTVRGWQSTTVPFGSPAQLLAGAMRPTELGGTPFVTGFRGNNVLVIQAAQVGQRTKTVLEPDTTYTLRFLAGISEFDSSYFFAVSLTAVDPSAPLPLENQPGVTRLQLGTFFPPNAQPDGVMRPYEFSYTTPAVLPPNLVGKRLGIHIFGSDGIPRVVYDDFRLTSSETEHVPTDTPWGVLTLYLLPFRAARAKAESAVREALVRLPRKVKP